MSSTESSDLRQKNKQLYKVLNIFIRKMNKFYILLVNHQELTVQIHHRLNLPAQFPTTYFCFPLSSCPFLLSKYERMDRNIEIQPLVDAMEEKVKIIYKSQNRNLIF